MHGTSVVGPFVHGQCWTALFLPTFAVAGSFAAGASHTSILWPVCYSLACLLRECCCWMLYCVADLDTVISVMLSMKLAALPTSCRMHPVLLLPCYATTKCCHAWLIGHDAVNGLVTCCKQHLSPQFGSAPATDNCVNHERPVRPLRVGSPDSWAMCP